MPQNGTSTGRDKSIVIILGDGTQLPLGTILDFSEKQEVTKERIKPINALNIENVYNDGWTGMIKVQRINQDLESFFLRGENNYYNGVSLPPATMVTTTTEPNGGVTENRYINVSLHLENAGDWTQDKSVTLQVSFYAARKF